MKTAAASSEKWYSIFDSTRKLVEEDETFNLLSAKEKLLTLNYYHFDGLSNHRDFIVGQLLSVTGAATICFQMKKYRKVFHDIVDPIIEKAIQENSLRPIPLIDRSYFKFFWVQHLFLLRYWASDESQEYENTIALIEKSMRSSFDFMSNGEIKSSLDLWKFLFQNPFKIGLRNE
jgi:hypothetical protein